MVCELEKHPDLAVEEQLVIMLTKLEMSSEKNEQRKELTAKLESWLSQSFPDCQFLPFGSSVTGLATHQSDLDLSLNILTIGNCILNYFYFFSSILMVILFLLFIRGEKPLGSVEGTVHPDFRPSEPCCPF